MNPQLSVSVARAGINNLLMSIQLNGKMNSRCAFSLKEIQVFHNVSRNSPFILPCSNDAKNQRCSASFSFSSQIDLCQAHSVKLRLVYKNGLQSDLLNSNIDAAETPRTSSQNATAVMSTNSKALTIKWKDPGCFLSPIEAWQVAIKPMAINITSPKLKSGGFILNETLPGSCVIDTSAEGLRNSSNGIQCYSLTLYKDQFFRCSLMNFTTKTFHYEPCSSYSIYLLPKTGDSFQHKFSLEWNFTTPLDPSGIKI